MGRPPKFKRIVLSFDESGYNRAVHEIKTTAELLNNAKTELLEALEIKFSDDQVQKFIMDRESIETFINDLYLDQPPKVRDFLRAEIRDEFRILHNDKYLYDQVSKYRAYLTVKNGSVMIDEVQTENLKAKFEHTIESERAKTAHELHLLAFETIRKLIEMGDENHLNLTSSDLFDYFNKEGKMNLAKLNYNQF